MKSVVKPTRAVDLSDGAARLLFVGLLLAFVSTSCKQAPEGEGTAGGRSNPNRNLGLSDAGADCAASCDDGFSCTVGRCAAGRGCVYSIGPNEGDTACPPNRYCTVEQGCIAAPACAEDEDCATVWADDACKDNPRCDPESSVCLFDPLDKDGDGHAPQVCGGDDCNDDDASIRPGKRLDVSFEETCNGIDDNCDGTIDNNAHCASSIEECVDGVCACPPASLCGGSCPDKLSDPYHCGECFNECAPGQFCTAGTCTCPDQTHLCDATCVDLVTDNSNCGTCGNECPCGGRCEEGACLCEEVGNVVCDGICVDVALDDANCGACGHQCLDQEYCQNAACVCLADTQTDSINCGACGQACVPGEYCKGGECTALPSSSGENLVLNGDFANDAAYWSADDGSGGPWGYSQETGSICVDVRRDPSAPWRVITWQIDPATGAMLDSAACYELIYDVWSPSPEYRDISVRGGVLQLPGAGLGTLPVYVGTSRASHLRRFFPLASAQHGLEFLVQHENVPSPTACVAEVVESDTTVCLDNVVLRPVESAACASAMR